MAADEVTISTPLLEQVKETLTTAYYYSQLRDLEEAYRQMKQTAKASPMTVRLNNNIELLQGFIELAKDDDGDDEPAGSSD